MFYFKHLHNCNKTCKNSIYFILLHLSGLLNTEHPHVMTVDAS